MTIEIEEAIRQERERILQRIEKHVEALMDYWPYSCATEPLAVLERLADEIEKGAVERVRRIVKRRAQAYEAELDAEQKAKR